MKVFYRASPFLSPNPNPLGKDKMFILKKCWESFRKTCKEKVFLIADRLEESIIEYIFDKNIELIIPKKEGNLGTFWEQLDLVSQLPNEEKVFLVEDDYLWIEDCFEKIEKALDFLDLISPYDHPGHYLEERFKNEPKKMVLIEGQTYREMPSNTLTFATKAWVIKQNFEMIKSFGLADHEMFTALNEKGIGLWCPVPSLATHLVVGLLAPNRDWDI